MSELANRLENIGTPPCVDCYWHDTCSYQGWACASFRHYVHNGESKPSTRHINWSELIWNGRAKMKNTYHGGARPAQAEQARVQLYGTIARRPSKAIMDSLEGEG